MDDKGSIQKLTREILEACIDRDTVMFTGKADEEVIDSDLWKEVKLFNALIATSDVACKEIHGVVSDMFNAEVITAEQLQERFQSGNITNWDVEKVIQICRMFFFLGWHARGAVEESEKMEGLL